MKYRCDIRNEAGQQCVLKVEHRAVECRFSAKEVAAEPSPVISAGRTMNKTETRYANILQGYFLAGEIVSYEFEALTFRLADRVRYTPDFMVVLPDKIIELHEVKGGWIWEDARVKLKVAAASFPTFRFKLAQYKKGAWNISEIRP